MQWFGSRKTATTSCGGNTKTVKGLPMFRVFIIILFAKLLQSQTMPCYVDIENAFYSENPITNLSQILNKTDKNNDCYSITEDCLKAYKSLSKNQLSFFKKERSFRMAKKKDTIIVAGCDYTGDGINEIKVTRIFKQNNEIFCITNIIAESDTIFRDTSSVSCSPSILPMTELSVIFENQIVIASNKTQLKLGSQPDIWSCKYLARGIVGKDSSLIAKILPDIIKYCSNFKRNLLQYEQCEGACTLIWYAPKNKFIEYYCP